MLNYLDIMTEVIRLLTFQQQPDRSREMENRAAKPRAGYGRRHDSVE